MNNKRKIRDQETVLIHFLLQSLNLNAEDYPIQEYVEEYEGGIMGSISLGGDVTTYAGDMIQIKYVDADQVPVIITLTKDAHNQLLDLDFWKEDFSKLIDYPTPDRVEIISKGA